MGTRIFFMILFLLIGQYSISQTAHRLLRQGDKSYNEQSFMEAEEAYRKALQKENTAKGNYNLGNTIYQQSRYEEAVKRYEEAAAKADTKIARANAYHNLGNALYNNNQLKESVEAYKNALRNHPKDLETKHNLSLAYRQLLKQQQQQQQQQQQNQDQQDQQQQQQDQQQQNQDQQQQQQNQQQQSSQGEDENDAQPQPQDQKDLSKEEARKLLEIMAEEERKVQEKLRKAGAKKSKSKKDW